MQTIELYGVFWQRFLDPKMTKIWYKITKYMKKNLKNKYFVIYFLVQVCSSFDYSAYSDAIFGQSLIMYTSRLMEVQICTV